MHKPPYLRKITLALDDNVISHLAYQGFKPSDTPKLSQRVHLRATESTAWGGGLAEDKTEQIHPDNVQLAKDIALALRLNVCGLDLMSVDISVPWYENQAKVLEANFSPYMAAKTARGRELLEHFISQIFSNGSRIQHQLFVGDQAALKAAQQAYQQALNQQRATYLIETDVTLGPNQRPHHQILGSNLYERWYSLLLHPKVESLIIHIDNDELVDTGLPIDQIEAFTIVNTQIRSKTSQTDEQQKRCKELLDLLYQHSSEVMMKNV
jgi:cyanophycin synthetase